VRVAEKAAAELPHSKSPKRNIMSDSVSIWLDYKCLFKQRVGLRFLFSNARYAGKSWSAFERPLHRVQLLGRADREDFDSTIEEISGVTADVQLLRFALDKKAEAHSLHGSRDEIALGLFLVVHKLRNCSRDRTGSAESTTRLVLRVRLVSWMA
jgi:hypothetical protein